MCHWKYGNIIEYKYYLHYTFWWFFQKSFDGHVIEMNAGSSKKYHQIFLSCKAFSLCTTCWESHGRWMCLDDHPSMIVYLFIVRTFVNSESTSCPMVCRVQGGYPQGVEAMKFQSAIPTRHRGEEGLEFDFHGVKRKKRFKVRFPHGPISK